MCLCVCVYILYTHTHTHCTYINTLLCKMLLIVNNRFDSTNKYMYLIVRVQLWAAWSVR